MATEVAGDTVAPQTGDLGDDLYHIEAGGGLHLTGAGEEDGGEAGHGGGAPHPTGHAGHVTTAGHLHEVAGTGGDQGQGHPAPVQGQGHQ